MSTEADPIVDNWYSHLDKGQRFLVVSVDEDKETVDIQHFDGDIEEISLATWYDMDIELSTEPENWAGATDVGEIDDFGTGITDTTREDWSEPFQDFSQPDQERADQKTEESGDDWGEGHMQEEQLEEKD